MKILMNMVEVVNLVLVVNSALEVAANLLSFVG